MKDSLSIAPPVGPYYIAFLTQLGKVGSGGEEGEKVKGRMKGERVMDEG